MSKRVIEYQGLEAYLVFFEDEGIGYLRLEAPNGGGYTWYRPNATGLVGLKLEDMEPLEDAFLNVQPEQGE